LIYWGRITAVLEALGWGLAGGSTLVIGALLGCFVRLPRWLTATVMAAGAGVLIASVAYELIDEATRSGGLAYTALGMTCGGLAFFLGDVAVTRSGGVGRKRSSGVVRDGASGTVLAVGALLDGIPESAAMGVTLLHGSPPGLAFVVAVALSNLPEGMSSSVAMRRHGKRPGYILTVWTGIMLAAGVSATLGYGALGAASPGTWAFVLAFAAGAVLTMLASTMLPEAAEEGGPVIGLVATAGFLAAVLFERL
jgi:ZIP family zinc transporter